MDPLAVIRSRLVRQGLDGEAFGEVADAVAWLGAVQAQEFAEAKWSLAERVRGATDESVEAAFTRGDILRTHALRPTWHFLSRSDARWILRLTRPRVHALNAYWYRKADLDGALFARADHIVTRALADEEFLTRSELADRLREAGIEATGPRLAYILMHAELEELVCSGPRRGRQHTYALFDERVPTSEYEDRSVESGLQELIYRYLRSHGPATLRDVTTWASLPVRESRIALAELGTRIESVTDDNGTVWHWTGHVASAVPKSEPMTRAFLLPMYDEMTVAYQDLRVVLDTALPRVDFLERAVVIDGTTVGTWKRTLAARSVVVEVTLVRELSLGERSALDVVIERFGRFLGLSASLECSVGT
ncbi:winged helix DNA-binding domain-containing protein [Mycetocola zhadangensis]|uniref:winged helix DNA-binding domain-containing protein n=1 Tax=Mycetocola zhadangensis TaxID=1164595 RepID=UPI001600C723|nr:winged helix DNA-binding domain-containing protein [Mycetocola zhadangensis]GGE88254.1 hypothetical protein GCM10011313_08660 [Mycetocola zhadangensis]